VARLAGGILAILLMAGCSPQNASCDRECLIALTDDYVAGLAAHDPSGTPLADDLIFVENLQRTKLGEGLWRTATSGASGFSIHVPDVERQAAGWMGVMGRNGEPVLVALRLKLEDGKIVEAEHLTAAIRPENLARLQAPRPGLVSEVPQADRLAHDRLIEIGASYYDALDDNDGSLMPFAADCERHENGMITAGPNAGPAPNSAGQPPVARDCAGQLSSNAMAYIDRIDNRRVFAADPVTGLVMGLSQFRHPMDFEPYQVTALDGSKITYSKDRFPFAPFDLPAAHIFKIGADGKVHEIEAMGFRAPYNSPTGWE
jgi:hypothetical protein